METVTNIFKGAWHYVKRSWSYVKSYGTWALDTFFGISTTIGGGAGAIMGDGWTAAKARWASGNRFKAAAGLLITWLGGIGLILSGGVLGGFFMTVFIFLPLLLVWALASWGGIQLGIFSALFVMGLLTVKAGEWLLDTKFEGAFNYNWHGFGLSLPELN